MATERLYTLLAIAARREDREQLDTLAADFLPRGSGFDSGCTVISPLKNGALQIKTSFHHMDDGGGYCGWTDHVVTVKPCLAFEFSVKVSGRNYRGIKDYIGEYMSDCLSDRRKVIFRAVKS